MPTTVRNVLSLALSCGWSIRQLYVKNVFLHRTLSETVYCAQPAGFEDPVHVDFVCRLDRAGISCMVVWYNRFAAYVLTLGFVEAKYFSICLSPGLQHHLLATLC